MDIPANQNRFRDQDFLPLRLTKEEHLRTARGRQELEINDKRPGSDVHSSSFSFLLALNGSNLPQTYSLYDS